MNVLNLPGPWASRSCARRPVHAPSAFAALRVHLLVLLLATFAMPAAAAQPGVTVVYSPGLDSVCALIRGGNIKNEWKEELASRKDEFESLWLGAGPKLIEAAEALTGKPFPAEPVTARLTLCDLPSQSIMGISVNMRYALKSFVPDPVPMRYKVDKLFHELLHNFLSGHPVTESSLIAQHASEPDCVRNHLHLLALQKAVLLRLGEPEALQQVISIDGRLPSGCYKRTWALVNTTDTAYLHYVAELAK